MASAKAGNITIPGLIQWIFHTSNHAITLGYFPKQCLLDVFHLTWRHLPHKTLVEWTSIITSWQYNQIIFIDICIYLWHAICLWLSELNDIINPLCNDVYVQTSLSMKCSFLPLIVLLVLSATVVWILSFKFIFFLALETCDGYHMRTHEMKNIFMPLSLQDYSIVHNIIAVKPSVWFRMKSCTVLSI